MNTKTWGRALLACALALAPLTWAQSNGSGSAASTMGGQGGPFSPNAKNPAHRTAATTRHHRDIPKNPQPASPPRGNSMDQGNGFQSSTNWQNQTNSQ